MKLKKSVSVLAIVFVGLFFTIAFVTNLASARMLVEPQGETAVAATFPVIADFEGGTSAGWFSYKAPDASPLPNVTVVTISDTDSIALPGQVGNNDILSATVNIAEWGGFGENLDPAPQDWSDYDAISFWFYGSNSSDVHHFELQTATTGSWRASFTDDFTGWQQIVIPFNTFTMYAGGASSLDVSQVNTWVFILDGTVGTVLMDHLTLVNLIPVADFEGGTSAGWFSYKAPDASPLPNVTVVTISDTDSIALPGQVGNNDILSATVNIAEWGGFGENLDPAPQDWSDYDAISFWFYGSNSSDVHHFELQTATTGSWRASFTDDFTGWQQIVIPFNTFTMYAGGASSLDVSQVNTWVFVLDGTIGSIKVDDVGGYGDAGNITLRASFDSDSYSTTEGDTATITVTLNATSTLPVTVTINTSDNTATSGDDYTAITDQQLVIPAGQLVTTFTVTTLDDTDVEGLEKATLTLSAPDGAELGNPSSVTLNIIDNEQPSFVGGKVVVIDDMENGLPNGTEDGSSAEIGFATWSDGSPIGLSNPVVADSDPLARPGQPATTTLLAATHTIGGYGGFTHAFENEAVNDWIAQDWSGYTGISFWFYGHATGGQVQVDLLDNRGTTDSDSAERFYARFDDDTVGWKYVEMPFADFQRRTDYQPGGAPDDGLTLTEVHGYAFGFPNDGGVERINYIDNVALMVRTTVVDDMENGLPNGFEDGSTAEVGFATWSDGSPIGLSNPVVADSDPLARPGQPTTTTLLAATHNIGGYGGFTHAFENEAVNDWIPQDWSSYEGLCFWFYGNATGEQIQVDLLDNRGTTDSDSAERFYFRFDDDTAGWKLVEIPFTDFQRRTDFQPGGAPDDGLTLTEVHGYALGFPPDGGVERTNYIDDVMIYGNSGTGGNDGPLTVKFAQGKYSVDEGQTAVFTVTLNKPYTETVTVDYASAESTAQVDHQYTPISGTLTFAVGETEKTIEMSTYYDGKHMLNDRRVVVNLYENGTALGLPRRTVLTIVDLDAADPRLVDDFEETHPFINSTDNVTLSVMTIMDSEGTAVPGQPAYEDVLNVEFDGASAFDRIFSQGQDWSGYDGLSFWYYGSNSGETVTMQLKDNMTVTTGMVAPTDWVLVWSDEFSDTLGTPPNPNIWKHELGDGAVNDIVGWGNSELQHYTNDSENASTDGFGNLVIRMNEVNTTTTDLVCWYGPCEYTSARLITQDQLDFEYGRIEARVQVPDGPAGLWPAFWMLGDDIAEVGWPQSGEIDIMEYVSWEPNKAIGTIHGPGYEGGNSYGEWYDFGEPVVNDYHTFGIVWQPDSIEWYIDDTTYHTAIPANVDPNEWVFNHPFFLILNMAIGGNFGGPVDPSMTMPQETLVDYVRVYQAADTAERFDATFIDGFTGWQKVYLPFEDFTRSSDQPVDAPDDGLTLTEIWGYGVQLPNGTTGSFHMDRIYLESDTVPTDVAINGPVEGIIDETYTFTATVTPMATTIPITYTWEVDDEAPVVNVVNLWQDVVDLSWAESGNHTITVTVDNGLGTVSTVHNIMLYVPPTDVALTGPITGTAGISYTFTATTTPITTTTPVTYTWVVDGQTPVVQVGGTEDTFSFMWKDGGEHEIAVTVDNGFGTATTTHTITLKYVTFFPIMFKN